MKTNTPFARLGRLLPALALASVLPASVFAADYPSDPLAHDRRSLSPETGSARGQTHVFVLGSLVEGDNADDTYLGGQIGIEFQLHEFGAIRLSGFQDVSQSDGKQLIHKFSSFRFGPALHMRPYETVDFGPYAEGGLVTVDLVDGKTSAKGPELVMGGFISIYVDSAWYVQMELERSWSNLEIDGVLSKQPRTAAKLGLGLAF